MKERDVPLFCVRVFEDAQTTAAQGGVCWDRVQQRESLIRS